MTFRIGIISDTHGLLRPEAERHLTGVDQIIHGGDIGHSDIIGAHRKIAPVAAIRGNVDTGDWAGDLLYATLLKHGLARGVYDERADDGLELVDCRIANAVRCVPPQNKPEPSEIKTCRQFLKSELDTLPQVKAILALGKVAHDSVCDTFGVRKALHPFKHGVAYDVGKFKLVSSYHCSRYNTNTGVLTTAMFEKVVAQAKKAAGI